MAEPTLAELAKRLDVVEKELAEIKRVPGKKDWRSVVGLFDDDPELIREILASAEAEREAERRAAREGQPE